MVGGRRRHRCPGCIPKVWDFLAVRLDGKGRRCTVAGIRSAIASSLIMVDISWRCAGSWRRFVRCWRRRGSVGAGRRRCSSIISVWDLASLSSVGISRRRAHAAVRVWVIHLPRGRLRGRLRLKGLGRLLLHMSRRPLGRRIAGRIAIARVVRGGGAVRIAQIIGIAVDSVQPLVHGIVQVLLVVGRRSRRLTVGISVSAIRSAIAVIVAGGLAILGIRRRGRAIAAVSILRGTVVGVGHGSGATRSVAAKEVKRRLKSARDKERL